jgi:UDP-N-acetylmuramoyl-tripeptide--D-alanyl-D-alanine ligase
MLTVADIVHYAKGHLLQGNLQKHVVSVSTDTRTLKKGSLFVALKGKNFDGHKFIHKAIQKGATALLVSEKVTVLSNAIAVICTADTLKAYGDLARGYRERFSIPVIAITGSVGKTTTKELVGAVLAKSFNLLKNYQTENNEIGVAKTLLNLCAKHQVAVLEFGTNHFGEIKRLTSMGEPTIAVLTNIGESHLEFLKNRQGVFKEKSDIFKTLTGKDHIVYNNDDDLLRTISQRKIATRKVTFAIDRNARYQAANIIFGKKSLSFTVERQRFTLKTLSRENIYNALAAIAVGRLRGLSWQAIRWSLGRVEFPQGRQNICKVSGVWMIDDTYNANPTSVASALRTLSRFSTKGKRFFVFADMRELGSISKQAHKRIGVLAAEHKVDFFFTYGSWSKESSKEAEKRGVLCFHGKTQEDIVSEVKKKIHPGDVVLVKGSRGMRMEKIVEKIKAFHF